jgi:hypothetical protein
MQIKPVDYWFHKSSSPFLKGRVPFSLGRRKDERDF